MNQFRNSFLDQKQNNNPKGKESLNQNHKNLISRSARNKPVVFGDDDPREDEKTDEAKMDDLLDTSNLRK